MLKSFDGNTFVFIKYNNFLESPSHSETRGAAKTAHVCVRTQIQIVRFWFLYQYANHVSWASGQHHCRQTKLKFILDVC